MLVCPSCRRPVSGDKPFCADCGASVHATAAPTEAIHGERGPAAPGAARALPDGSRFIPGITLAGRYRIVSLLGKGGMGEVYRADDLKLGQPVALKFLPPAVHGRRDRLERLLGEARLARQVSHPNVCRVHDVGEVDGQTFLSMEYVDGENLASLLRRIGRLPGDKAVVLARQICAGVAAAHEQGILHRDLKPSNVMIDGRGRARITDFGLAALPQDAGDDPTAGTPAYMAPEQLAGGAVTVQSDLYALGLVLYELFTGRSAFAVGSPAEVARSRKESTPSRPSDLVEGFDPAVERVILRCLEPDPADRPRSALAVSAALPGGDPLAAALAAGETPSPDMVAAAGEAQAMDPWRALALVVATVSLFVTGATLEGRHELRAYLPMDKPPAVQIDRAREIIARLGYTEPAYARPADTAVFYDVRPGPLQEIRGTDPSPDRWRRLRDVAAQVLSFWYRQSPRPLVPSGGATSSGRVRRWNPFPDQTGEVLVSLEPDGRLGAFVAPPRRYTAEAPARPPFDWSIPFALAGLDMADFEPVQPRYQRYMHHDQRAAWRARDRAVRYRVEAGANEGRLSLFVKVDEGEARQLAEQPEKLLEPAPDILSGFFVVAFIAGAVLARVNVRRGRADVRSALRMGAVMGSVDLAVKVLSSQALLAGAGRLQEIITSALGSGVFAAVLYLAVEPVARSIWPSMLVSWTRLLGRVRPGWRDPIVGRAALAGLVAGACVVAVSPLRHLLAGLWDGAPPAPDQGNWIALLSQREAWAEIFTRLGWSVFETLIVPFLMVLGRLLLRRPAPAALAAAVMWIAPDVAGVLSDRGAASTSEVVIGLLFLAGILAAMFGVLLRWGLVGLLAMNVVGLLGHQVAPTTDWTAWHAQPSILCVIVVGALCAFAYWAATPGRHLLGEAAPVRRASA